MKTRIKRFYKRFIKVIRRSDMKLLPGQLAFFMVLAIVPTLTLLMVPQFLIFQWILFIVF